MTYKDIAPRFYPEPPLEADTVPSFISNIGVNGATGEYSIVFQAPKSGDISGLFFRTAGVSAGCTLDVRLELPSLDSGIPTGRLASASSNASVVVASTDDNKSFPTTLSGVTNVNKGDWLAARLDVSSGTPTSLQIASFADSNLFGPYILVNNLTPTAALQGAPIFSLQYSDGAYISPFGCIPISELNSSTFNSGSAPNNIGNQFQLECPLRAKGCWAWLDADASGSALIYDSNGSSVLASGLIRTNMPPTAGAGIHYLEFSQSVELQSGVNYYLTMRPYSASNLILYHANAFDDNLGSGLIHPNFKLCSSREPTGTGSWTITGSGAAWMGLVVDGVGYSDAVSSGDSSEFFAASFF